MNHMTIAEKTAMLESKEQVDHHTEQSNLNEVDELLKDEKFLVLRNIEKMQKPIRRMLTLYTIKKVRML